MNITSLTVAHLKQMTALVEKKEALQAEVARLDAELARLGSGESPQPLPTVVRRAKVQRTQRGAVKAAIVSILQNAGKSGVSVKDIAAQLGAKYAHVFAWFYSTGSKIKEIKRVGPGRFGWLGTVGVAAPRAGASEKPATKAAPAAKQQPGRRGKAAVAKDTVIAMIKATGSKGITVKAMADKLSVDPQRIYTWFNAVGKKIKEIKKIAPATYIWKA
jgi:hypothetical protein